jgi:tRNA dimethylallyltransferase
MNQVPHHLFDFVSPLQNFSLADYYSLAGAKALELLEKGITPVFTGGTGLYLRTLQSGLVEKGVSPHPQFRMEMEKKALEDGNEFLYAELQKLNPQRAAKIHVNDLKRIIRALEICYFAGESDSEERINLLSDCKWRKFCITRERSELYCRIEKRIDDMVSCGLIEEVKGLISLGVTASHTAAQALGFRETSSWLRGEIDREQWLSIFKQNTRHFAKRQMTWLRSEQNLEFV